MTDLIQFIPYIPEPTIENYTCTLEQLKQARETFADCIGYEYFKECYEAGIKEFCEIRICK